MRKLAIVIILSILLLQNIVFAKDLRTICEDCVLEVNVEEEIKNRLEIEPIFVSLDECLDTALENNFKIKSITKMFESSKYEYQNSLSKFLPNAGLEGYVAFFNGQVLVGGALSDYLNETAVSGVGYISHDLTAGGSQIFQAQAKKNLNKASGHKLDFTKDEVLLRCAQGYYKLLSSKLSVEIYIKNYRERKAQLKLSQNLKDAGLGTNFDVIRGETELAQAQQNLLNALYEFRINQAKLANIMGIEITTALTPIETKPKLYELIDKSENIETLYTAALQYRDDIKGFQKEIDALKDYKLATYSEFIPKGDVRLQKSYQGTKSAGIGPNTVVMFNLNIPIGQNLGVGTITKAKAQGAEISAKELELENLKRYAKESILNSYYNSKVAKERAAISEKQVEFATESVKLAELRLDAGEGILIDVIQAQTFKTQARIELLRTIVDYDVNQIQLLFDAGIISSANILKGYAP